MGSYSKTYNETDVQDKRLVVDGQSLGISADNSTVTVNSLDADIVRDTLNLAGDGFARLLSTTENMFLRTSQAAESSQDAVLGQLNTLSAAQVDSAGGIDQKTMLLLIVAGAGVLALFVWKKGK